MKISSKGFKQGYNEIVTQKKNADMNMDFGVLCMSKGEKASYDEPKECIYVLLQGKVTFSWDGNEETVERGNVFHDDPVVLHLPPNVAADIVCLSERAELAVQRTTNPRSFAPALLRARDLLNASEHRGAGTMNEASARIVRTYFDRSNCPETNFFVGEVVSLPGKWSSYPPHTHVEPEIYYYRFLPENGYGFAEMGDEAYKVRNNDVTCMAGVSHSQATAPGYAEWYLWVIRLRDDIPMDTVPVAEHAWAEQAGAKYFPDI
jgi:5-deoxy-glucuronate isomerase